MILDQGHYCAVKTYQVPVDWLNPDGVFGAPRDKGKAATSLVVVVVATLALRSSEALLRSCSSKKQFDEIRSASSRKSLSLSEAWSGCRRCSSEVSHGCSHKIIKEEGVVKDKIIQWNCIVCGYHLEGTYQAIQHKMTYHIRVVHSAFYQSTLQQRREEGCKQSGLCVKALARPREFVRDPQHAVFQCPWCNLYLTGPLSDLRVHMVTGTLEDLAGARICPSCFRSRANSWGLHGDGHC